MDYLYDFEVNVSPGERACIYVAKIVGEDPKYNYRREFVPMVQRKIEDGYQCEPELEDYGIYERSIKWFEDKPNGRFRGRCQEWYLVFDCYPYKIPAETVADTWQWLSKFLAEGGAVA